jgi:hypothetical protein
MGLCLGEVQRIIPREFWIWSLTETKWIFVDPVQKRELRKKSLIHKEWTFGPNNWSWSCIFKRYFSGLYNYFIFNTQNAVTKKMNLCISTSEDYWNSILLAFTCFPVNRGSLCPASLMSLAQGTHIINCVKASVRGYLGDCKNKAFPNIVINICVAYMTSVVLLAIC